MLTAIFLIVTYFWPTVVSCSCWILKAEYWAMQRLSPLATPDIQSALKRNCSIFSCTVSRVPLSSRTWVCRKRIFTRV